jgi:putative flippase GtrA
MPSPATNGVPSRFRAFVARLWKSWATRSLAIGLVATGLDIALGTSLLVLAHVPTRWAAMIGSTLGATFTFLANRYFAFRERTSKGLGKEALRFVLVTAVSSLAHGQLVVWLRDHFGVPFVPAKMAADLVVFTLIQLVLLRYVVFTKKKKAAKLKPESETQPRLAVDQPGRV